MRADAEVLVPGSEVWPAWKQDAYDTVGSGGGPGFACSVWPAWMQDYESTGYDTDDECDSVYIRSIICPGLFIRKWVFEEDDYDTVGSGGGPFSDTDEDSEDSD